MYVLCGVVFIIIIKNRLQKEEKVSFDYNYKPQEEEIERKTKNLYIYITFNSHRTRAFTFHVTHQTVPSVVHAWCTKTTTR